MAYSTSSQRPPFAAPTRFTLFSSFNFDSCFSTARSEIPMIMASSGMVTEPLDCISSMIFPELFPEPSPELFPELFQSTVKQQRGRTDRKPQPDRHALHGSRRPPLAILLPSSCTIQAIATKNIGNLSHWHLFLHQHPRFAYPKICLRVILLRHSRNNDNTPSMPLDEAHLGGFLFCTLWINEYTKVPLTFQYHKKVTPKIR